VHLLSAPPQLPQRTIDLLELRAELLVINRIHALPALAAELHIPADFQFDLSWPATPFSVLS
jgi:hypothetical protein